MSKRKKSRQYSGYEVVTLTVNGKKIEAWSIKKIGIEIGLPAINTYYHKGLPKPFLCVKNRKYYPKEFAELIIRECRTYNIGKWAGFYQIHAKTVNNPSSAMIAAVREKWFKLDFWKTIQYTNTHSLERSKDIEP